MCNSHDRHFQEDRDQCRDTIQNLQASVVQFSRERSEIMKRLTEGGRLTEDNQRTQELRDLSAKHTELLDENTRLLDNVTAISVELNGTQRKNIELSKQLAELTAENCDRFSSTMDIGNDDSQMQSAFADMQQLNSQLIDCEQRLQAKASDLSKCETELNDLSMQHKEVVEVLRSETDVLRCMMEREQQEAESASMTAREEKESLLNKLHSLETECAKANDLIQELRQHQAELEQINASYAQKLGPKLIDLSNQELENLCQKASAVDELMEENSAMKQDIIILKDKLHQATDTVETNMTEITALKDQARRTHLELEAKSTELADQEQQAISSETHLMQTLQEMRDMKIRCDELSLNLQTSMEQRKNEETEVADLMKCIEDKSAEITMFQQIITDLEGANSMLRNDLEKLECEVTSLENGHRDYKSGADENQRRFEEQSIVLQDTKSELNTVNQKLESLHSQMSEFVAADQMKNAEVERLVNEVHKNDSLKETLKSMEEQLFQTSKQFEACSLELTQAHQAMANIQSTHNTEKTEITNTLNDLQRELDQTKEQLAEQERQALDSETHLMQTLSELRQLKSRVEELNVENEEQCHCRQQMDEEVNRLKAELQTKDESVDEMKQLVASKQTSLNEEQERYAKLENDTASLVRRHEVDLNAISAQMGDYEERMAAMMEQASRVTEVEHLLQNADSTSTSLQETRIQVEQLTQINEGLQLQLEGNNTTIKTYEALLAELREKQDTLEAARASHESHAASLSDSLRDVNEQKVKYEEEISALSKAYESLSDANQLVNDQVDKAKMQLDAKEQELDNAVRRSEELSESLSLATSEQMLKIDELTNQIVHITNENTTLQQEYGQLLNTTSTHQALEEQLKRDLGNKTTELQHVRDELDTALHHITAVEGQISELKEVQQQLIHAEQKLNDYETRFEQDHTDRDAVAEQLSRAENDLLSAQSTIAQLHQDILVKEHNLLSMKGELDTLEEENNLKLADVGKTLDEYKTKVDESMEKTLRKHECAIAENMQMIDDLKAQLDERDTMLELKTAELTQSQVIQPGISSNFNLKKHRT